MKKTTNCWKCGKLLEVDVPELGQKSEGDIFNPSEWMDEILREGLMCDECKRGHEQAIMLDWLERRLEKANLRGHEFLKFDRSKGNMELARWVWRHRKESLWIANKHGIGKTRCVIAAAGEHAKEATIVYFRSTDLLRTLQAQCAESMRDALRFVREIESYDLLIIDDFGKEKLTDKAGELFYDIIDHRYASQKTKKLWITSNFSGKELVRHLGSDKGPAIIRRLRETCLQCFNQSKDDLAGDLEESR